MDRLAARPAVGFETKALDDAGCDALTAALTAAFPELAEVSLKRYGGPGWVGAAELASAAGGDGQARLAAWLRGDPRVVAASVRPYRTEPATPALLAALRAQGLLPPE